jgi:hypothetical protein
LLFNSETVKLLRVLLTSEAILDILDI